MGGLVKDVKLIGMPLFPQMLRCARAPWRRRTSNGEGESWAQSSNKALIKGGKECMSNNHHHLRVLEELVKSMRSHKEILWDNSFTGCSYHLLS